MTTSIAEQVVVITGASSGIGRETAKLFAQRGATVVLAARNDEALTAVATEIERDGGSAHVVHCDVGDWTQVEHVAQETVDRYGRIDTWVNNAGVSAYATVEQMTIEEIERIVQVTLVSQMYGVKAALPSMTKRGSGTIINVSSVLGKRAVPLQSIYSASKHGVKGFTDALRMELQHEHPGINVTLIMPTSMNTPFFEHARSKMGKLPKPVPPVYDPGTVAEAIVFAAEHLRRDIVVGGAGKLFDVGEALTPALLDRYMTLRGTMFKQQMSDQPDNGRDNLFAPVPGSGSTHGQWGDQTIASAPFTRHLEQHPVRKKALLGVSALGALFAIRRLAR